MSRKLEFTKIILVKKYIEEQKSLTVISHELNCSLSTIHRKLKKYLIPIRDISKALKIKQLDNEYRQKFLLARKIGHGRGKYNKNYKEKIKINCKQCNKEFKVIPARKTTAKFCSRKCHFKWKKINITGKNASGYKDGRSLKTYYCKCGNKINWQTAIKGGVCKRCIYKYTLFINNSELRLLNLINICLGREYKFTGNGKVIIDKLVPDFINIKGQKKIIELYGDYWHNKLDSKQRDKRRIKTYSKYGYKTLIIWEHELKEPEQVIAKIMEFNYNVR